MNKVDLPPLVLIAGPTASGKSALAMALADLTPSVIVNADSMQVYRDLRVLTARPSEADEARHPHRLFGYIDGAEACSAARWANDAKTAIAEAHAYGRLPVLVGGTGLYIRTLLDGIAPVPEIDADVRRIVRAMPIAEAHMALSTEDPGAAGRLSPNDRSRIMRALEVVRSTGRTLADWQGARVGGIAGQVRLVPIILLPPRDWLNARIDARFEAMFDEAMGEVARLRGRNLSRELPVWGAIGATFLDPAYRRDFGNAFAIAAGQSDTRRYAKRQHTWFKNQPPADWLRMHEQLDNETIAQLATILHNKALTA